MLTPIVCRMSSATCSSNSSNCTKREAFRLMSSQAPDEVVPELREVLLTQFTSHLYKAGEIAEIPRVLNSPLAKKGGLTASLHFALGVAYNRMKQFSEAAEQMRQCIAKRKQPVLSPINSDILTAAPNHCLALSLAKMEDVAGAEKAFRAALSERGKTEEVKFDYAKFLESHDRSLDALHQLHELVKTNARNAAAWRLGGEIALKKPEYLEFARDWTAEAIQYVPDDAGVVAQRAEALMLSQEIASARPLWERLCQGDPAPQILAAGILCAALESQDLPAMRNPAEETPVSRAFVRWYQRLLTVKAKETILRLNERLEAIGEVLPTAARMLEAATAEAQKVCAV